MDIDYSRRNIKPRPLTEAERLKLEEFVDSIHYSTRYVGSWLVLFGWEELGGRIFGVGINLDEEA